ncbi:hypothetical protein [Marinivivus vitaminiproducens]|uniref:hypothetical protein n=1 Tax=Marinivivus vitaminiproducens TaxID=3035935 RepID=UPI00279D21AF|nr:hypothetical protein P4R82_18695 [Geminicoccaceae bacterium SCSIO 64248]
MPRDPLEDEDDDEEDDDALDRSERAEVDALLRSPRALALAEARPSDERDSLLWLPLPLAEDDVPPPAEDVPLRLPPSLDDALPPPDGDDVPPLPLDEALPLCDDDSLPPADPASLPEPEFELELEAPPLGDASLPPRSRERLIISGPSEVVVVVKAVWDVACTAVALASSGPDDDEEPLEHAVRIRARAGADRHILCMANLQVRV